MSSPDNIVDRMRFFSVGNVQNHRFHGIFSYGNVVSPSDFQLRATFFGCISDRSPIRNDDMCQGLNSHYFHIIGDGHQPNSRGLYTHYKDSLLKVGGLPSPIQGVEKDPGSYEYYTKEQIFMKRIPKPRDTCLAPWNFVAFSFQEKLPRR